MAEADAAQPEVQEVVSDGLALDLTNSHLRSLQDVPLAPTLTVGPLIALPQRKSDIAPHPIQHHIPCSSDHA